MSLFQTLLVAFRALMRNKFRSFLTTLGVIIGVGAVVAMVAIGEGAKSMVESSFAAMGSNLIIVMSGTTTSSGAHGGFGSMPTLTWDDLKAIQTELPSVKQAAPSMRTTAPVLSDDENWTTSITGTTPEYFQIRQWPLESGAMFSPADSESGSKVVVLGKTVADKLFGPGINPVGLTVRIKNIPMEVIGVLIRKGQSPMGQDYDDAVFVPKNTFLTKVQGGLQKFVPGVIFVSSTGSAETARAEKQIRGLLRDRHHLAEGADDDFSTRNLTEMASAQQEGTKTLTTLLASIAAVSLLVGGIGIMNIMLVSVTQRTREIGTRVAVGARPRDILSQFLVEALTLSLSGGLIGVGIGIFSAYRLASAFGWPVMLRPDVAAIAMGFSGFVGVAFGLYPAVKASRMDPIEALRFE